MSDVLLRTVDNNGVAVLTFNRPRAANTWSVDLHVGFLDALRELATDEKVRAVVVTGAGRHTSAPEPMSRCSTRSQNG